MSQWEDAFKDHEVHTTLGNLQTSLADKALASDSSDVMELVDRIRQASEFISVSLENVIPSLCNIAQLAKLNSQVQNILNEINNYNSNKNIVHLQNTSNHIDNALNQIPALPISRPRLEESTFQNSAINFKTQVESILAGIKEAKDKLASDVSDVQTNSETQKEQLEEIENQISQYKSDIADSISSIKKQFEQFEANFNKQLSENIKNNDTEIEELISAFNKKHAEMITTYTEDADTFIKSLNKKESEAATLVQLIGEKGVTGNYQRVANEEKKNADRWRMIALILMIMMVGTIVVIIFDTIGSPFDWKATVFRTLAALILAIPAAYAARESGKHREIAKYNRSIELQLAALDPYLEKLPEEKRQQIKVDLTDKFFGVDAPDTDHDEPVTYSGLVELIKLAIKR